MEERTKKRLIGTLVLIGMLCIILPFLFHNSRPTMTASVDSPNAGTPTVSLTLPADNTAGAASSQTASDNNTSTASSQTAATDNDASTTIATTTTQSVQTTQTAQATTQTQSDAASSSADTIAATTQPTVNPAPSTTVATNSIPAAPSVSPKLKTASPGKKAPTLKASAVFATDKAVSQSSGLTTGAPNGEIVSATTAAEQTGSSVIPGSTTVSDNTTTPVAAQQSVVAAAEKPSAASLKTKAVKKITAERIEKPVSRISMRTAFNAWTIQLGAFSDRQNAMELMNKLRQHQFDVYSRQMTYNQERLTVVFVGPEVNRIKTENMMHRLKMDFGLNGEMKKYQS